MNSNKDKVSLEETLSYIKYLNQNQPFDREEIVVPTHDIEKPEKQRPSVHTSQEKSKKLQIDPSND